MFLSVRPCPLNASTRLWTEVWWTYINCYAAANFCSICRFRRNICSMSLFAIRRGVSPICRQCTKFRLYTQSYNPLYPSEVMWHPKSVSGAFISRWSWAVNWLEVHYTFSHIRLLCRTMRGACVHTARHREASLMQSPLCAVKLLFSLDRQRPGQKKSALWLSALSCLAKKKNSWAREH